MNTFAFDASWNQIKGKLQQKFGQLTDDDLNFIEGKGDELLGRLQWKLGMSAAELNNLLQELKGEVSGGAVRAKIDSVKAAAGQVAEELRGKATHAVDELKHVASATAEEFKGQAGEAYEQARQKARTLHEEAEDYVRQKPREALFTAVAAGFVAGLLLRR
jgi:uncharacterized protein YjbJ (UPF0337 family)